MCQHGFSLWLDVSTAPIRYLNQCWYEIYKSMVYASKFIQTSVVFIHKNSLKWSSSVYLISWSSESGVKKSCNKTSEIQSWDKTLWDQEHFLSEQSIFRVQHAVMILKGRQFVCKCRELGEVVQVVWCMCGGRGDGGSLAATVYTRHWLAGSHDYSWKFTTRWNKTQLHSPILSKI